MRWTKGGWIEIDALRFRPECVTAVMQTTDGGLALFLQGMSAPFILSVRDAGDVVKALCIENFAAAEDQPRAIEPAGAPVVPLLAGEAQSCSRCGKLIGESGGADAPRWLCQCDR